MNQAWHIRLELVDQFAASEYGSIVHRDFLVNSDDQGLFVWHSPALLTRNTSAALDDYSQF